MVRALSDRPLTLLIVDDEESMRDIVKGAFDPKTFKFYEATNGLEALDLLKKQKFDCVISDVRMPKMDGAELLRRTKAIQYDLPVLLITGYADLVEMDAFDLGAEGIFMKPFSRIELGASVLRRVNAKDLKFPDAPRPSRVVSRNFSTPQSQVGWKDFKLGRGGFFLGMSERLKVNETLRFEIGFQGDNFLLKCVGIVRWARNATPELPAGYGVEIVGLDDSSRLLLKTTIMQNRFTAHIPKG
jgi:two-component system, response regulator, stage 0 sporulation protein F